MTREEKAAIIGDLVEKFRNTPYFYITNAAGLTVAQINDFRRACFQSGLEYKVYKNTLIAKALEQMDADYSTFNAEVLKGQSGILFSPQDGKAPSETVERVP